MKVVYCAKCGTRLAVSRKALPKYGKIIDIVEYHECSDEPVEIDLTPVSVPVMSKETEENNKFVQNLDKLIGDKRDKSDIRVEKSSTAPQTLLDSISSFPNSTPVNKLEE